MFSSVTRYPAYYRRGRRVAKVRAHSCLASSGMVESPYRRRYRTIYKPLLCDSHQSSSHKPLLCDSHKFTCVKEQSSTARHHDLVHIQICSTSAADKHTKIPLTCSFSRRASSSVTSVTSITSTSTVRDDSRSGGTVSRRRGLHQGVESRFNCGGLVSLTRLVAADSTAPFKTRPLLYAGAFARNAEARHAEQETTTRSLCRTTIMSYSGVRWRHCK